MTPKTPHATIIECAGWFRGTLLDSQPLRVDAFCEPLDGHCGDFIGLYRPSPTVVLGVIADACGHGAEAAALLEAAAEPSSDVPLSGWSPAELLEAFGAGVAARAGAVDGKFIPAMVFTLDMQSGILTVALAEDHAHVARRPATTAERTPDGWRVTGAKTVVPAGTVAAISPSHAIS